MHANVMRGTVGGEDLIHMNNFFFFFSHPPNLLIVLIYMLCALNVTGIE